MRIFYSCNSSNLIEILFIRIRYIEELLWLTSNIGHIFRNQSWIIQSWFMTVVVECRIPGILTSYELHYIVYDVVSMNPHMHEHENHWSISLLWTIVQSYIGWAQHRQHRMTYFHFSVLQNIVDGEMGDDIGALEIFIEKLFIFHVGIRIWYYHGRMLIPLGYLCGWRMTFTDP